MNSDIKRSLLIFGGTSFGLAALFFLFPINLFDGVIVVKNGMQVIHEEARLSLSYFIGMGYNEGDLANIEDFYLTTQGYIMAFLFIFGFPALFAYRIYLRRGATKKK